MSVRNVERTICDVEGCSEDAPFPCARCSEDCCHLHSRRVSLTWSTGGKGTDLVIGSGRSLHCVLCLACTDLVKEAFPRPATVAAAAAPFLYP